MDFTVVSPRQLRITGRGIGVTDLSITTARNETYVFEVRVLADLTLIDGKLHAAFPDASIKLSQIRDHIVIEGEARDPAQITRIIETLSAYLQSVFVQQGRTVTVAQTGQILGALGGMAPGVGGAARSWRGGPRARRSAARRDGNPPGIGLQGQPLAMGAGGQTSPFAPYAASAELGGPTQTSNRGLPPDHQPDARCRLAAGHAQGPHRRAQPDRPAKDSAPTSWAWIRAPAASWVRSLTARPMLRGRSANRATSSRPLNSTGPPPCLRTD